MLRSLRFLSLTLSLLVALLAGGCKKETVDSSVDTTTSDAQKKADDDAIQAYVSARGLTATRTASGLYYVVDVAAPPGAPAPVTGSVCTVNYRGYLLNSPPGSQPFDSSYPRGVPFVLTLGVTNVIAGWTEGLKLMHKGERGRLIIPSHLAYGPRGSGTIAGNAVLIFYMSLENVQ